MSDEVGWKHAGAKGLVGTFIALAMPDHAHRLFTLICFPFFSVPLAPTYGPLSRQVCRVLAHRLADQADVSFCIFGLC